MFSNVHYLQINVFNIYGVFDGSYQFFVFGYFYHCCKFLSSPVSSDSMALYICCIVIILRPS